jgi:5-methylcytosine-specific restriction enzyme subunit McrC
VKTKHPPITVFEHEVLRTDRGGNRLSVIQLEALQRFYGENGVPYFSLVHHGVKFCEYVGVLQVGNTIIEVLPKADKHGDEGTWRSVLIGMLHAVGIFKIHAPSSSDLQLRPNAILDLYFELYIKELEYLLHRGLVKRYRKTEGNSTVLKGSLQFARHISKNLVHQERFYVRYTTFDKEHQVHAILYKALKLLHRINTNAQLNSRLGVMLLDFPEMPDIKVTDALFERIQLDRKTEPYRNAIEIARLLLLNYHPDVSRGNNDVLALMFDMNVLWEQFVYVSLRKHKPKSTTIHAQSSKYFWKPTSGSRSKIKPDIVLNRDKEDRVVLDTKWKNLQGGGPSPEDLRQLFVYSQYFNARRVALIYPGAVSNISDGWYYDVESGQLGEDGCSVVCVAVNKDVRVWQRDVYGQIERWCELLE